jgi:hypothetical protein
VPIRATTGSPHNVAVWRRKTPAEFRRDAQRERFRRLNPLPPVLMTIGVTLLLVLADLLGSSGKRPRSPVPLPKALESVPVYAVVTFVVVYVIQILRGTLFKPHPLQICRRCYEITVHRGSYRCDCGGILDEARFWVRASPRSQRGLSRRPE